jgi:hypothetical protein
VGEHIQGIQDHVMLRMPVFRFFFGVEFMSSCLCCKNIFFPQENLGILLTVPSRATLLFFNLWKSIAIDD